MSEAPKKAVRVTLTASQAETNEGIEIIEILRMCLEKRRIDQGDILFLKQETDQLSSRCDFPCVPFIAKTLSEFEEISDCSDDAQFWLQEQLLRIFPKEVRDQVKARRRKLPWEGDADASDAQVALLDQLKVDHIDGFSKADASREIDYRIKKRKERSARIESGDMSIHSSLITERQRASMRFLGVDGYESMTKRQCSDATDFIYSKNLGIKKIWRDWELANFGEIGGASESKIQFGIGASIYRAETGRDLIVKSPELSGCLRLIILSAVTILICVGIAILATAIRVIFGD